MRPFAEKIKHAGKHVTGLVMSPVFRGAGRLLPVDAFHAALRPLCRARAAVYAGTFKKRVLPDFLQAANTPRVLKEQRAAHYLNQVLKYFPERLAEEKWRGRCRIEGLERLSAARQSGRPVILVKCHFGPYFLLQPWLAAAGFPVGVFKPGHSPDQTLSGGPKRAVTFWEDQWDEAAAYLEQHGMLSISLDVPHGAQVNVPLGDGWNFSMCAHAMQVARRHRAELIPCWITDEGAWNFRIGFGAPVPGEFLAADPDNLPAARHLLAELMPVFRARPDQFTNNLFKCFKPVNVMPAEKVMS